MTKYQNPDYFRREGPEYPGVLGEPLRHYPKRPKPGAQIDDPERKRAEAFLDELKLRYVLLFKHFGIDPDDAKDRWLYLAFALAQRHVPGLQVPEKRGTGQPVGRRPTLDKPEVKKARADLLVKVEELRLKRRDLKSDSKTLKYLRAHAREAPDFYVNKSGSRPFLTRSDSALKQYLARERRERNARNASVAALASVLAPAALEQDPRVQKLKSIEQELVEVERQLSVKAQARQARAQTRLHPFPFGGLFALGEAMLSSSRTATLDTKPAKQSRKKSGT